MNKRQNSQYKMLETVETHFNSNAAIWSSNPLISDAKATLSDNVLQIMAAMTLQRNDSVGATADKTTLRKDLEEKAFFISTAICAYISLNSGQKELYKTVYIPKSTLSRAREADLLLYIEELQGVAVAELENLGPYGVFEVTITELTGARSAFYDMLRTPAEVTASRKEATEAIAVLLHQTITLLDDTMDRLVEVLRRSEPKFVDVYFSERRIHKVGTRAVSLEITTVNAAGKIPLAKAQIEVMGTRIKRKSSEKGQNRVQNLKEGNYTLLVSHPDFVSQTIPFTIIGSETTLLVVEMLEKVAETL